MLHINCISAYTLLNHLPPFALAAIIVDLEETLYDEERDVEQKTHAAATAMLKSLVGEAEAEILLADVQNKFNIVVANQIDREVQNAQYKID